MVMGNLSRCCVYLGSALENKRRESAGTESPFHTAFFFFWATRDAGYRLIDKHSDQPTAHVLLLLAFSCQCYHKV